MGRGVLPEPADTPFGIDRLLEIPHPRQDPSGPSPLGAGYLILVPRELTRPSQRALAARIGTSQSALAKLETGNGIPSVRTLLRVAEAAGFELVIGLRRPDAARPDPAAVRDLGFALLGILRYEERYRPRSREPTPQPSGESSTSSVSTSFAIGQPHAMQTTSPGSFS
jgi:transcriptional regulator with XRE-family HTH domain